jgi:hypothetical protein
MAKCVKCGKDKQPIYACERCDQLVCYDCWMARSGTFGGLYCPNCQAKQSKVAWELKK